MAQCKRCDKPLGILSALLDDYCASCNEVIEGEKKIEQERLAKDKEQKKENNLLYMIHILPIS
ncbi:MAG: hypothetical protein HN855_04375 [Anaerolineae bacterium]|jgi:hypothetical protein|nr:hypothetical protein [Anaerolineae bacterium]MBT7016642.1 hypothetical protein [Anaerolineae bacterium]MBT7324372.1 hypothetical protein [Anaerolineae bacterium]MBT7599980.1 hypothetical protein [Anaerolineae bacterium]